MRIKSEIRASTSDRAPIATSRASAFGSAAIAYAVPVKFKAAHLLVLCCLMVFAASSARADERVECDRSHDACDAKILEQCPGGADVLEEKQTASAQNPNVPRFRIEFRCRDAGSAAPAATAPAAAAPESNATAAAPAPANNAPSPDDAARRLELQNTEARLAEIKASRRGLAGPLVLTGIGAVGALSFSLVSLAALADAEDAKSLKADGYDVATYQSQENTSRTAARVTGGIAVASLGMAAGGLIWLFRPLHTRRQIKPEYDQLRNRQRELRSQVQYGFAVDPSTRGLLVSGRF